MPRPRQQLTRRTLDNYKAALRHALGKTPDSAIDQTRLVNDAGYWLFDAFGWRWRNAPPASISTVADQTYVELPVDFGELIGRPIVPGNLTYSVIPTTIEDILIHRQANIHDSFTWYLAFNEWREEETDDGEIVRVAEIWPTPSTSETDKFSIAYRRTWRELEQADDVPNIPRNVELLLELVVREFAIHLEDQTEAVESILQSKLFQAAVEADGRAQHDYGPMRGGLYEGYESPTAMFYPHRSITKL